MRGIRACPACIVGHHRSGWIRERNPAARLSFGHHAPVMPDPFLIILAVIAIATVILFPIRQWRRRRHRYGADDEDGSVPLTPPKRRDSA
jgi:hypothetical protein